MKTMITCWTSTTTVPLLPQDACHVELRLGLAIDADDDKNDGRHERDDVRPHQIQ